MRGAFAPTGNTHFYSWVSFCMLDSTPEEPRPHACANCSLRSRSSTHRMMHTWAALSLQDLRCAVASSSPPHNCTENVGTVDSLPVEPRPLFSSACTQRTKFGASSETAYCHVEAAHCERCIGG